ncbi:HypC/HybG/HupF family hydrogenase formation chaperone [Candidatus Hydrogenisulfobacillus filiaventi]|uniref:HypC/HybG/HupF family hydrogenase formation chaperone n=1 Tax=Candidatus Hydrogenisulfobacillus filiaventi TaxID=2707344 RepID=A0A6F8ZFT6_9FIRM|nr:HypC/HybG/HupF family hydrogenase formation chaperone [Candidatus Hydrogenisulfobacillus filiaventi]
MCLAIPGKIVEIVDEENDIAKLDVSGVRRNVNIALLRNQGVEVSPGSWVLVHVGFAMSKLGDQEAKEMLRELKSIGREAVDDIKQWGDSVF